MSNQKFILKSKNKAPELLAISTIEAQQIDSEKKLILLTFEKELLSKFKFKMLFMRVGNEDVGIYNRFRNGVWYVTKNFDKSNPMHIEIYQSEEHKDIWEWLEKRINPIAITVATILSTFITFSGIIINSYLEESKIDKILRVNSEKIEILENKLNEIKKFKIPIKK